MSADATGSGARLMSAKIDDFNTVRSRCAARSVMQRIWPAEKWVSRFARFALAFRASRFALVRFALRILEFRSLYRGHAWSARLRRRNFCCC
jgi:hypothetical protein